jgi:plasmid rolling circle replication initiator protein Rep
MNNTIKKNKKQEDLISKFDFKKSNNLLLSEFIKMFITLNGYERFLDCGTYLKIIANTDFSIKKVIETNYCGNRFCPICTWIKSKKDGYMLSVLMKYINEVHKKEFIFVTLTSVNVVSTELINEIDKFNISFKKLMKRKEFAQVNKGYVRTLELTYNKKENTYNPHFHIIIAVNRSYFTNRTYLKQEIWLQNWKDCMQDDRITQVDVRRVNKEGSGSNAINEITKYVAKDTDYLHSEEVFEVFYKALKGRQLITYNGIFKDALKLYKSKDKEINLDKYKEIDRTEYMYFLQYAWGNQDRKYLEKVKRDLTDEEYDKFNSNWIDEMEE